MPEEEETRGEEVSGSVKLDVFFTPEGSPYKETEVGYLAHSELVM